jgi:radical SAM protein with 4Fe4S-binding SPASM domain
MDTLQQARANIGWHCNPILDIDLDQTAIFCYPLEDQAKASLNTGMNATELRTDLAAQVQVYDSVGIYKECSACSLFTSKECTGGCLANRMKRFRPANINLRVPYNRIVQPA